MIRLAVLVILILLASFQEARARLLEGDGSSAERGSYLAPKRAAASTPTAGSLEASNLPANMPTESAKKVALPKLENPLKTEKAVRTSSVGRAPAPGLGRAKSGVPLIPTVTKAVGKKGKLPSVSAIQSFDIGEEPRLERSHWEAREISEFQPRRAKPEELPSPKLISSTETDSILKFKPELVSDASKLKVGFLREAGKVTVETIEKIKWLQKDEVKFEEIAVTMMTEDELKLLRAEILVENGKKCHLAAGLLRDLLNSADSSVQTFSKYHLGICLHRMGLYSESVRYLKEVIRTGAPEQVTGALKTLLLDLPFEFEEEVASELKKISPEAVPAESRDSFHYIQARAAARQGHFQAAFEMAQKVGKSFSRYSEVQFMLGVSEYALERKSAALERLARLKGALGNSEEEKRLSSLVAINLARTYFQDKKYTEALQNFREIRKDHSLWVDALIEQGWAQLHMGDASGAIGNMYSIHSPYFKAVYQPESYVVRTIGYLGICQYGDAYRTLSQLEAMYRPWLGQISKFRKTASGKTHYESMLKYLKGGSSQATVEGLPYQVLREIGRHKDFLNLQEGINRRVEEGEQYTFIRALIEKEKAGARSRIRAIKDRLAQVSSDIKKADKNPALAPRVPDWKASRRLDERRLAGAEFELRVYEESGKQFAGLQVAARKNLAKKKSELQAAAGEVLKVRLKNLETRLVSILENNELLRYEVFSQSGENIRFHATSTGEEKKVAEKRMPRQAKPENKDLRWNFDGEFWEDEIGHYRSSLRNNCPENRAVSQAQ